MKKHEILSPQSRAALFDPPTEPAAIVRRYTFSSQDLALIRQRRRASNRLGFAAHLAFLKFPGRVLGADEHPSADMLAFIAAQIGSDPTAFEEYAWRDETRREHLGELQTYLDVRSFRRENMRAVAHVAIEQATGSDRGDVIVSAMIEHLRERRILLPAAVAGLNLAVAAITLWNTVYLGRAVDHLRSQGEVIDDTLLAHIAPLGWEHITFNGDYVWPTEPLQNAFRPLRNPRSALLDPP